MPGEAALAESLAEDFLKHLSQDGSGTIKQEMSQEIVAIPVEVKPEVKVERPETSKVSISSLNLLPKGKEPVVKLEPLKQDAYKVQEFNINMSAKQVVQAGK